MQETAPVKTGFIALPIPEYLPKPELLTLHFANGLLLSGIAPNNIDVVKQLNDKFDAPVHVAYAYLSISAGN
jgi:hypothetical protein